MTNGNRVRATHGYVESQDVKLKEHLIEMLDALDKRIDARLIAMENVIELRFNAQDRILYLITDANDKAHNSMNEFRGLINDQTKMYITRADHELLITNTDKDFDSLREDIESLKLTRAELAGKASQGQLYVATAISLIGLLMGAIGIVLSLIGG